jgi:small subunit ribosomal protein S8
LKELGFVESIEVEHKEQKMLVVTLAYEATGTHRIHGVKRISKPGRRLYVPSHEAHSVQNGMGARILSTPKGILSDAQARKVRAGGETLFEIW